MLPKGYTETAGGLKRFALKADWIVANFGRPVATNKLDILLAWPQASRKHLQTVINNGKRQAEA